MNDLLLGETLRHMFVLGVPVVEKVLRPWLVYTFLVVGLRLAGKRELAQINTFDLIVLLTLSNTVQNAIIGEDNSVIGGLLGATSLLAFNYFVVRFLSQRARLDRLLEGEPVVLIEQGRLNRENLRRQSITRPELETAAHKQGFRSLKEVDHCILETGGSITFVGKEPSPTQLLHDDLMRRLDDISRQLEALQGRAD